MNPSHVPSNVPEADQVADTLAKEWKEAKAALRMRYGPEDNSWEPKELLEHSQEEISCFNKSQLKKAHDSTKSL
ncbi:hypothetical protein RhiXN_10748 [Rhizoctonia solani]|uniref:Chromo domain-containing protein n=1 Tax=Rhizoctonia solani TaxID=456999 RepID=A0A8H8P7D9_9AGAM|nr:uncharacterized protein RhiXN_10748 [Rhizoctonia solani]QRW25672.1 hypothetical protein RhiXN_10748 [Rhizoctonia solani]